MRVAVIGQIGSGKSCVMDYLKSLDFNVFDCDVISKDIMTRAEVKKLISEKFNIPLDENGNLNKEIMSSIIFSESEEKDALEKYIHTLVLEELETLSAGYADIFVEVSAFKDSVVANFFDVILGVLCDKEQRIERIVKRNGFSLEKIESIMSVQPSEEEIRTISNYTITNDGGLDNMHEQINKFLEVIYANVDNHTISN